MRFFSLALFVALVSIVHSAEHAYAKKCTSLGQILNTKQYGAVVGSGCVQTAVFAGSPASTREFLQLDESVACPVANMRIVASFLAHDARLQRYPPKVLNLLAVDTQTVLYIGVQPFSSFYGMDVDEFKVLDFDEVNKQNDWRDLKLGNIRHVRFFIFDSERSELFILPALNFRFAVVLQIDWRDFEINRVFAFKNLTSHEDLASMDNFITDSYTQLLYYTRYLDGRTIIYRLPLSELRSLIKYGGNGEFVTDLHGEKEVMFVVNNIAGIRDRFNDSAEANVLNFETTGNASFVCSYDVLDDRLPKFNTNSGVHVVFALKHDYCKAVQSSPIDCQPDRFRVGKPRKKASTREIEAQGLEASTMASVLSSLKIWILTGIILILLMLIIINCALSFKMRRNLRDEIDREYFLRQQGYATTCQVKGLEVADITVDQWTNF